MASQAYIPHIHIRTHAINSMQTTNFSIFVIFSLFRYYNVVVVCLFVCVFLGECCIFCQQGMHKLAKICLHTYIEESALHTFSIFSIELNVPESEFCNAIHTIQHTRMQITHITHSMIVWNVNLNHQQLYGIMMKNDASPKLRKCI